MEQWFLFDWVYVFAYETIVDKAMEFAAIVFPNATEPAFLVFDFASMTAQAALDGLFVRINEFIK